MPRRGDDALLKALAQFDGATAKELAKIVGREDRSVLLSLQRLKREGKVTLTKKSRRETTFGGAMTKKATYYVARLTSREEK